MIRTTQNFELFDKTYTVNFFLQSVDAILKEPPVAKTEYGRLATFTNSPQIYKFAPS